MNSFDRLTRLDIQELPHCPKGQFAKGTGGSVGYDLKVCEDIIVPSIKTLREMGSFYWLERKALSAYNEQMQKFIESDASKTDMGRGVFKYQGTNLIQLKAQEEDYSYEDKSFYVNAEGIVYAKEYIPLKLRTGIKITPSNRCWFMMTPRSGAATKLHINLLNGVGVIDPDYPEEYLIAAVAHEDNQILHEGERIAQVMIMPYIPAEINRHVSNIALQEEELYGGDYGGVVNVVGTSTKRIGGFGSTGM